MLAKSDGRGFWAKERSFKLLRENPKVAGVYVHVCVRRFFSGVCGDTILKWGS